MLELSTYFPHMEEFRFRFLFDDRKEKHFWHVLLKLHDVIDASLAELKGDDTLPDGLVDDGSGLLALKQVILGSPFLSAQKRIFLEAGVTLEAGVVIKPGCLADSETVFRQGAYIRGNVIIGKGCVAGHTTEVKNSVIMNHTEAGHFNYVGDSILGSYVNLGAGTKFANLPLRTTEEKKTGSKKPIPLLAERKMIDKTMTKLGVIAGDGTEFGCNSVTCPGVFLGPSSLVYPNVTVRKGFYPAKSRVAATNL